MKACGRGGRHSLDPGSRLASIREASGDGGGGLSDGWIMSCGLDLFLVSAVSSSRHCEGDGCGCPTLTRLTPRGVVFLPVTGSGLPQRASRGGGVARVLLRLKGFGLIPTGFRLPAHREKSNQLEGG